MAVPGEHGGDTVWERWDSMLPDGTVNPGEMTGFNHYAFGSVGGCMHRVVAGISPLEPGYRRVLFAPQPGGGLTSAGADIRTPLGMCGIHWSLEEGRLRVQDQVAPSMKGVLRLPDDPERVLGPGKHEFEEAHVG